MPFGAPLSSWQNFVLLGLSGDLLPVVGNPNAKISPNSTLKALGKVPSLYNSQRLVVGIPNWTAKKATWEEAEAWAKAPDYSLSLQTREARALDIDVPHKNRIEAFIRERMRVGSVRRRSNSEKSLIPFLLPGAFPKRVLQVEGGIVEFLGNGQQFVAVGTHPSGARYDGLEEPDFPVWSAEAFETLWADLVKEFGTAPPTEAGLRNPLLPGSVVSDDPVVAYLEQHGHVTGAGKEGQVFLRCPFESEHSEPDTPGGTATAYFPAGGRGYEQGHFKCLHAHCSGREDVDFLDAVGYRAAAFEVLPPESEAQEAAPRADRFQLVRAGAFSRRPPVKWLIKDIVAERGSNQVYGASGDGKTFAVLDMMMSFCRGVDWNGHRIKRRGKVVYICAEGAGGFQSRLKAYATANVVDLDEYDFWVMADTPNFRLAEDIKAVAKQMKTCGNLDLFVVDTLAQVIPGADENAAKDMSLALQNCVALQEALKAASLLVAHAGKDPSKGSRGWSGQKGRLDMEACVSRKENGLRTIFFEKIKDGRDGFGYDFELRQISFAADEDEDVEHSCVTTYYGA